MSVEPVEPEAELVNTIVFEPNVTSDEDLALFNGDFSLRLGATRQRALQVFEPPQKSMPVSALPPKFGESFSAIGWETDNLSFGAMMYKPKLGPEDESPAESLVLAMYTQDNADEKTIEETVTRYTAEFGDPTHVLLPPGGMVRYWFWIKPRRWLMVNSSLDHQKKLAVTVALGAPQVMRELGMAVNVARVDQQKAIDRLNNGD